ncbi:MAG: late competence development ComFB family protein [Oscillibacter sp.]|nr:late competence development ComFB family protein [Oscillibacter sp.]
MKMYQNMMETMVEDTLDIVLPELDCCTCEFCRNDMVAYALNHLPPRYVVTQSGSVISKADTMRIQHMTDIRTALVQAAQVVKEHPRH